MDSGHGPIYLLMMRINKKINPLNFYRLYCAMVSLKLTVSALICFGIIGYFGLDNGYLLMLPMLFGALTLPQRMHQTIWECVLGSVMGAVIFIVLIIFSDHFLIYTVLNLAVLSLALLIGFKSRFLFTAVFLVVTGGVIYSLAITGPTAAVSYGIEWARDGFFGALVFFMVDFLICPYFGLNQLEKSLKNTPIRFLMIEDCQKLFQVSKYRFLAGFLNNLNKIKNLKRLEKINNLEAQIGIAGAAQFYQKRAEDTLSKLENLSLNLNNLNLIKEREIFLNLKNNYKKYFSEILISDFFDHEFKNNKNYKDFFLELDQDLDGYLKAGLDYEFIRLIYSFKMHLDNLVHVLSTPKERKIPEPPVFAMPVNSPLKMALLAASTLCSVVCVVSFLALPGGMQPVFAAFVAAMQPNLGKLSKQLLDRFLGVVFGGAASVFILLTLGEISHFWMLIFIFGVFVSIFIYFSLSRPQWAYIFLQAALTVLMLVAYNTLVLVPTIDVVGQRFFGISVGFVIGFMIMALFGLESAGKIYTQKFHAYLSRAGQVIFKTKPLVPQNYFELVGLMAELKVLLSHTEFEFGSSAQAGELYQKQFFLLEHIGYNLETLLTLRMHEDRMNFKTDWLIQEIKKLFLSIEKVLKTWPDLKDLEILKSNLNQLDQKFQQELKQTQLENISPEERMHCFALQTNLQSLARELSQVRVF